MMKQQLKRLLAAMVILGAGLVLCTGAYAGIPTAERQALIDLYNSTNGDGWTNNDGWKTEPLDTDGFAMPGTECSWYGVTCDAGENYVTEIDLGVSYPNTNNLVGTIPASIGNFTNLQNLDLSRNQLTETIPAELGNLFNLTYLNLNINQLTGSIPAEIGNLSNLTYLNLGHNQLTGEIPTALSNLTNLTYLSFAFDDLTGNVPDWLGSLTDLQTLNLSSNKLTGTIPSELSNLTNLINLSLCGNGITGTIPTWLGNLTKLESLSLSYSGLQGEIPTELSNLTNLKELALSNNFYLTGNIPIWLGNLTSLEYLYLHNPQLIGDIPVELGNLINLRVIMLGDNNLTSGSIPEWIANLTNLQTINLGNCNRTGTIPSFLGNLSNLTSLDLSDNQLTGTIPTELLNLTSLRDYTDASNYGLDLCNNSLYTTDTALRDFLNTKHKDGDWESCQQSVATAPTINTTNITNISSNSATSGGNVTSDGGAVVTAKGVCWSTTSNPTTDTATCTNDGTGAGSFTSFLTNLTPDTTYYFRAYAINSVGTAYGEELSFKTLAGTPVVSTSEEISNITQTTATVSGEVISDKGSPVIERGICWSSSSILDTANPLSIVHASADTTGTGTFSVSISGLTPETTYYFRAYAVNAMGLTALGNEMTFITLASGAPTVTTTVASNITTTTATVGGNVVEDFGAAITAAGICYSSTLQQPTLDANDGMIQTEAGLGSFIISLTGLNPGTTYYFRAYATNSTGTGYGNALNLTTDATLPTVATTAVSDITSTSAISGGKISDDGGSPITARGVCWRDESMVEPSGEYLFNCTSDGTGIGEFSSSVTGLNPGTTYYFRAYATNSKGTAYGNTLNFTTSALPTVEFLEIKDITTSTATVIAEVTVTGGSDIAEIGFCWSSSVTNPTKDNSTCQAIPDIIEGGEFSASLTGLDFNTTYYVNAYAANSVGIAYGEVKTFTTDINFGDINGDGIVDLNDNILALKILTAIAPGVDIISLAADINGDGKMGAEEAIFTLDNVMGGSHLGEFYAGDVTLKIGSSVGGVSDTLTVEITAEGEFNLDSIASAAFTLEYSSDLVLTSVESDFFDTYAAQFESAGIEDHPVIPTSYDQPLLTNELSSGKTLIAATRSVITPNAKAAGNVLFTLTFALKEKAREKADSIYEIRILPTILSNIVAGYDERGESLNILLGSDPTASDISLRYPVMIDNELNDMGYSAHTEQGNITIYPSVPDGDGNGDGFTDVFDALVAAMYDVDLLEKSQIPRFPMLDVVKNNEGEIIVDANDVIAIIKYAVGSPCNCLLDTQE